MAGRNLPCDLGVAIVIVNQRQETATFLHEILPTDARAPVELIAEGWVVAQTALEPMLPAGNPLDYRPGAASTAKSQT